MASQSRRGADRNRRFYDRWVLAYDLFTRYGLPLRGARAEAAHALSLSDGDVILEFGCGPGPNIAYIQSAISDQDHCQYVGVDIANEALYRAQQRANQYGWYETSFLQGDATTPPIHGSVDAILSTFVLTIFPDPEPVLRRWIDLLGEDGRLVLLNAHPSEKPIGTILNPWFNLFLLVANPIDHTSVFQTPPWSELRDRVNTIEATLDSIAPCVTHRRLYGGFLTLSIAEW